MPFSSQLLSVPIKGITATLFSTGSEKASSSDHIDKPSNEQQPQLSVDSYGASKSQWNISSPTSTTPKTPQSEAPSQIVSNEPWVPTQEWVTSWKSKLPLQTIMRLLQVRLTLMSTYNVSISTTALLNNETFYVWRCLFLKWKRFALIEDWPTSRKY